MAKNKILKASIQRLVIDNTPFADECASAGFRINAVMDLDIRKDNPDVIRVYFVAPSFSDIRLFRHILNLGGVQGLSTGNGNRAHLDFNEHRLAEWISNYG